MNPATIATATMPGQASDGMVAGQDRVPDAERDDPVDRGGRAEHHGADRGGVRAVIGVAAHPVAALAGEARRQDDPDGVDDRGREDQQDPRDGRRGVGVDPTHGQHHAEDGDPERRPCPAALERPAEPEREHGDDRRVEVHDQRRQAERHRLEAGVVRGGVADVQHAQADGAEQGPAGERLQRPARAGPGEEHEPGQRAADREPPGHERQPVDAGRVHRLREQAARAERDGADDDERDAGGTGPIHGREGIGGRAAPGPRRSGRPPVRASARTLAS